ncbi:LOW QUALITY PROTEIN: transmembrane protein 161B-like [Branchiostoma floridae]|uniref:LOW QUALITY PROTEIN: transmembrane protein 161B-like n=1 Tax=Branchiostoma floridae TaxID=7739 RepID=A0A9J7KW42_BRAFL|nr:LOW QUALITY PROTEIN: transmembrane protein 161B-like [Branchiostoma floridae]
MAVIGTQLVVSMVMASIIQKLQPHFSAARWLLSRRLVRYLHPTDDKLRELAVTGTKGKGRKRDDRRADGKTDKDFTVPCSINLQLETAKVERVDIIGLQFYTEYQWLIDFSGCALAIYLFTEGYYYLVQPRAEVNLSVIWCLLVVVFILSLLFSLTAAYFTGDDSGERSICLVFGFFFLLVSMAVLITSENILEFGLDRAYTSLSDAISGFLGSQGVETSGASSPSSKLMFKGVLAVYSGLVGAFLTFSGLRFGKMHQDSLQYSKESPLMQLLLHLNFLWPLVVVLMWVKPLARGYVLHPPSLGTNSTVPVEPLMSEPWFETSRLYTVIFCVVLRLVLMHRYLQSYLNMAHQRIEHVKKQAGRISNMEIQKRIVRVFFYLCVVAVQYLAPVVLLLFYVLLLKTLGEYSWTGNHVPDSGNLTKNITEFPSLQQVAGDDEPVKQAAQQLTLAFASLRNIFSAVFFRGVVSYLCWWSATTVFVTTAFGMIYHSVFTV